MSDKKSGNMHFWKNLLTYYSVSYQNLAQLVKIIFAASGGTSSLERPHSTLAKLYYQDMNKLTADHMEMQFLFQVFLRSMNLI